MRRRTRLAPLLAASALLAACSQPAAQLTSAPASRQAAPAAGMPGAAGPAAPSVVTKPGAAVQPTVRVIPQRPAGLSTAIAPEAAADVSVAQMRAALAAGDAEAEEAVAPEAPAGTAPEAGLVGIASTGGAAAKLPKSVAFPAGFLWGAATAAHQVEGHMNNDWTGAYEETPGNIKNGDTSKVGVDFWNRYDADMALAQGMGHNSHRLSIEWSKIEPARGERHKPSINHYHEVFAAMKARGIKPLVTLHHFTSPKWVAAQGGWTSDKTIGDFARFAAWAALEYGAEVDCWIPINEPNIYAFNSYESGIWPPQHKNRDEALLVMANMAKGHAAAYRAIKAADQDDADGDGKVSEVGTALHVAIFDAARWWHPVDVATAYFNDRVFNRAFFKAVTSGELDFTIPGAKGVKGKWPDAKNTVDFLGFNYYTRWMCKGSERTPKAGQPITGMGWEVYPEGIYRAAKLVNGYRKLDDGRRLPLMITENGIDDHTGNERNAYTVRHLQQVGRAIDAGIEIKGYMAWTLMDNFEWAEGYTPKFGLYKVDRANDLARIPTPTVALFKDITAANGLTAGMIDQYGDE